MLSSLYVFLTDIMLFWGTLWAYGISHAIVFNMSSNSFSTSFTFTLCFRKVLEALYSLGALYRLSGLSIVCRGLVSSFKVSPGTGDGGAARIAMTHRRRQRGWGHPRRLRESL